MISEYINAAMHNAKYEILEDDGAFYGEIPECNGVWATSKTLEVCREELESALESWLLYRLSKNLSLPEIDGISLMVNEMEAIPA